MIKAARNVVADAIAHAVVAIPPLERVFRAIGRHVEDRPLAGPLHRRTRDTLTDLLKQRGSSFRPVEIGGVPLVMDVADFTCHRLYFHGDVYEPATVQCLVDRLRPGQTFVDVGANHGYFSVLAARLVGPSGRVFAFEPNPDVMERLCEHVARNTLTNVTAEPLALADRDGSIDLFVSACATNSGLSTIAPEERAFDGGWLDRGRRVRVTTTTVDRWRAEQRPGRIDLMKIDVEGAEALVLRGMATTLAEAPPAGIICEEWDGSPSIRATLVAHGYHPRDLDVTAGYRNVLYTLAP